MTDLEISPKDEAAISRWNRGTLGVDFDVDVDGETYHLIEGWALGPSNLIVNLDTYVDLCRSPEPPKTSHRRSSYNYRSGFPKRRLRRFRGRVLSILKAFPKRCACDLGEARCPT